MGDQEAKKLVEEDKHPDNEVILAKQHEVDEAWSKLKDLAQVRSVQLKTAIEIHTFRRNVEEAISWMKEKEDLLQSNEIGSDIASVEALQRRHAGIERDLAALAEKVSALRNEADKIEKEVDDTNVGVLRDEMIEKWSHVTAVALLRKQLLATDVSGAEALVDKHQEHHGEIGAQDSTFTEVLESGKFLLIELDDDKDENEKEEESSSSSSSSSDSSDDENRDEKA